MGGSFTYEEIGVVFLSIMGHLTLTLSLQPLVSTWLRDLNVQPAKGVSSLHWCSRVVSVFHAVIATCLAGSSLLSYKYSNALSYNLVADMATRISIGYFVYDTCLLIYNKVQSARHAHSEGGWWAMLLHHMICITGLSLATWYKRTGLACSMMLFQEITNIFLHALYFMKHFQWGSSEVFALVSAALLFVWLGVRIIGLGSFIYLYVYNDWQVFTFLSKPIQGFVVCIWISMLALNLFWFLKLVQLAKREVTKKKESLQKAQ